MWSAAYGLFFFLQPRIGSYTSLQRVAEITVLNVCKVKEGLVVI